MKLRVALLLVVTATVCALSGLISPQEAAASVVAVNQWPAKPTIVSNSNTAAVTGSFTVAPGTKRLMLVAVAIESTTAPTVAVTYGGQSLTQILLNTTGANKIWVGRLNDAGIVAAGANKTLSATLTGAGTITATYVTAAVYAGVDQATPVIGSGSLGTGTAALTIGPVGYTPSVSAINGNNGLSVYLVNWNNTTVGQTTPATGFTEVRDYIGTNFSLSANYKVTTGAAAESITSTTTASSIAALAAVTLNPAAGAGTLSVTTVTTCGDCHGYPPQDGPYVTARNVPPGQFPGAHSKHSGTDEGQYGQICTVCHKDNGTAPTGLKHADGFKNITGSGVPRNTYGGATNIPMSDTTYTETCTKSTCHSTGRTTRQYAASPVWSGTTTCLSCHAGRSTAGLNPPSRSVPNNFTLSTSHSQHLKYLTGEMNCQTCHGKIASSHTALKDYTGAIYHGNGTKNVNFTQIAYGSYTSYKSFASGSSANTKVCNNTSCHGGQSRGGWKENLIDGGINANHTCTHCHGVTTGVAANLVVTGSNRYNLRFFAPGWGSGATKGTSTDMTASSNDRRVGSHFKHLSSAYMKNIKCNECHQVPDKPFATGTNHTLNTTRFNSGTLDFTQSSSARILIGVASGSTLSQLATFTGYTNGTASTAATCSSTYCHGSRLKTADTSGTYSKPYWNYSAMINYSNPAQACARCHGNPPLAGTSAATHSGKAATVSCYQCHASVVNNLGAIINKNLHINGQVNAANGHAFPYRGSLHKDIVGATTPATTCSCHDYTGTSTTYPVARGTIPACRACHTVGILRTVAAVSCYDCHGSGAAATAAWPNGTVFPNNNRSHTLHSTITNITCNYCHTGGGTGVGSGSVTHGNYSGVLKVQNNTIIGFGAQAGLAATWVSVPETCNTSICHGQKSPAWGITASTTQCTKCHGQANAAYLTNYSSALIAPGGTGVDTGGNTTANSTRVGAHQTHLLASSNISDKMHCGECHVKVTAVADATHLNYTTATVTFVNAVLAKKGTVAHNPTATKVTGIINCSNTYCHTGNYAGGTVPTPVWNNSALLAGTINDCTKCHLLPPTPGSGSHAAELAVTTIAGLNQCSSQTGGITGCHPSINGTPTTYANIFFDRLLHINGSVEGGTCVGCHNVAVSSPIAQALDATVTSRLAITPDFARTSHHKRSGTAVRNEDCCVCHMEGTTADGKTTAVHKDGRINLRNPDTGANILGVTHNGTTSAPGVYADTAVNASPVRFRRNLGSNVIEPDTAAMMINNCLKCHDAAGATSTLAQVPTALLGTALKPFGATVAANPGGSVLNVASQFASTNRSFHPVLVRNNAGYTNTGGTRMAAPWNAVTKSASTTIYGPLITCWDCHAPKGSTSATILTTFGVHGAAVTAPQVVQLRGDVYVNGATATLNLCVACHTSLGTTNHGTGSAFTSSVNSGMTYANNRCYFCHSSVNTNAHAARPYGAGDAHGYNTRGDAAQTAITPVSAGYAFIRRTGLPQSIRMIGATTYTPTCGSATGICNQGMGGYTPGGVY